MIAILVTALYQSSLSEMAKANLGLRGIFLTMRLLDKLQSLIDWTVDSVEVLKSEAHAAEYVGYLTKTNRPIPAQPAAPRAAQIRRNQATSPRTEQSAA
jgi:hypothetical protein